MKDFLGQEYGPGDLVVYGAMSGRCVNMIVGRVLDTFSVYESRGSRRWERLTEGELPPFRKAHGWLDADGNLQENGSRGARAARADGWEWREYETADRLEVHPRVRILPLRGARWQQHSTSNTYWVDTRTGRRIDPTRTDKHTAVPCHYEFADGMHFDYEAREAEFNRLSHQNPFRHAAYRNNFDFCFRSTYHVNYWTAVGTFQEPDHRTDEQKAKTQLWRVPDKYKDYVEERREAPKGVLIEVTENIVKFNGELPAEGEAAQ